MIIAPSILNANNLNLKPAIAESVASGISRFHVDIMDGHFVPNLSFGPQLVKDFHEEFPQIELEIHLMSNKPDIFVPAFVKAGATIVELHYEAMKKEELNHWLDFLIQNNVKTALVLSPDTPLSVIQPLIPKLDQVLLMTVYPGFGGQKFLLDAPKRIAQAKEILSSTKISLEVDGGINDKTAVLAQESGANVLVVGSYLFKNEAVAEQIARLKRQLK